MPESVSHKLTIIHRELATCRACPNMIGPSVHGPAIASRVLLVGQAPGPREASFGRPFAWTAGKTLFRWFDEAFGIDEETFRAHIYMAAVARCFPGKAKSGGDRRPDRDEIGRCRTFLARETEALSPSLVIPVGGLAIEEVLGKAGPAKSAGLASVIGQRLEVRFHDALVDVVPLPHPSGVSSWHKTEPGKTLLARALSLIGAHPAMAPAFEAAAHRARP